MKPYCGAWAERPLCSTPLTSSLRLGLSTRECYVYAVCGVYGLRPASHVVAPVPTPYQERISPVAEPAVGVLDWADAATVGQLLKLRPRVHPRETSWDSSLLEDSA
jgi:hypothetical protein